MKTVAELPTVSAIIPIYNGARHLAAAITSVLAQDVLPHELILIDDGRSADAVNKLFFRAIYCIGLGAGRDAVPAGDSVHRWLLSICSH